MVENHIIGQGSKQMLINFIP